MCTRGFDRALLCGPSTSPLGFTVSTANLNLTNLRDACLQLARHVLLERSEAPSDRAQQLAADFEDMVQEDLLEQLEPGRDPNLIVRIVQFLAQSDSATPFEPYGQWFFGVALMLMELACPSAETMTRCAELYSDISTGQLLAGRGPSDRET